MFDNTPSTENFPNLYPHGALNQAKTVIFILRLLYCVAHTALTFSVFQDGTQIQAYVAECCGQIVGVSVIRQEEVIMTS